MSTIGEVVRWRYRWAEGARWSDGAHRARFAIEGGMPRPWIALLMLVVASCDLRGLRVDDSADLQPSAIVARVGAVEITAASLSMAAASLPERDRRALGNDLDAKRRLLEPLIREAALFEAAVRGGIDRQPDVARRLRQLVVEAWTAEQRALLRTEQDLPERELRAAFEREQADPRRSPLVQVRVIWLPTRERAEAVRAALLSQPGDLQRVAELARSESLDEASRDRGGDLGFVGRATVGVPEAVVSAALRIPNDWGVAEPVPDRQRWAVVLRTAGIPVVERSFEQARAALQAELGQQRREQALTERIEQVRVAAQVVWDDQVLAQLRTSAPSRTSVPTIP
ncbi:MAG: peptidyl-prolyl cis-trans isomerase [Proteobacteria bacterium]|nr:peptidyl-prolyl cis-trans isomerase [Pseudomonadota bacterium]